MYSVYPEGKVHFYKDTPREFVKAFTERFEGRVLVDSLWFEMKRFEEEWVRAYELQT